MPPEAVLLPAVVAIAGEGEDVLIIEACLPRVGHERKERHTTTGEL